MGDIYCTIGYHKAEQSYAEIVKDNNAFKISHKNIEWLGDGIYFWENPSDADWWCKTKYKHYTIFSADLSCESKYFVDFDDEKNMSDIIEFAKACQRQFTKSGVNATGNSLVFKAAVCNYYKEKEGILLMRYSFPHFEYNYAGFPVDLIFRPQYCATNNTVINHFEVIEEG